MAHNLATNADGSAVYYGRESAWHAMGHVIGRFMSAEDICQSEGLNFEVEKRMLYGQAANGEFVETGEWGIFRTDNNVCLASCGGGYEVIQHPRLLTILDTVIASSHDRAYYETAGALGRGEVVFASINLDEAGMGFSVGGEDMHTAYLNGITSHDGSKALDIHMSYVRIVCQNTMKQSLNSAKMGMRVYHTKNANLAIDRGVAALAEIAASSKNFESRMNLLADRMVNKDVLEKSLVEIYRPKKEGDESGRKEYTQRGVTRYENLIEKIMNRYEDNDGNAFPAQRGTLFNLLNAITAHTDHERDNDQSLSASFSAAMGTGAARKVKALEVLLDAAGNCIERERTVYVDAPRINRDGSVARPDSSMEAVMADLLA